MPKFFGPNATRKPRPEGKIDPFGMANRCRKPIVTAVQGIVFTVGLEMMLAGDIVVAADDCRFCQMEAERGIAPLGGAHFRFISRVGWALRGKANFASFAPTKAAQRILAESIAREMGPKGIHVAYLMIDAVIDVAWTRQRFKDRPDEFFIQPAAIADEAWHLAHQPRSASSFLTEVRPFAESW
jgi:NAD(P)-dependent dehydrogenase (short-subunit alcohol dehydrogenase family)